MNLNLLVYWYFGSASFRLNNVEDHCEESNKKKDMMEREQQGGQNIIYNTNKVMTFRIIKFFKRSLGGPNNINWF